MPIYKSFKQLKDWTTIAQGGVLCTDVIDVSALHGSYLEIQAFLDTETAHTGTEVIIQGSSNKEGNEDWHDFLRDTILVGTANLEAITNNPLAVGVKVITCASTTGYTVADLPMPYRAIKDGVNSELVLQTAVTANTNITVLDGVTNSHVATTPMSNIACSFPVFIPKEYMRVRVIFDNNFDSNGSTLYVKVRLGEVIE